MFIQLFMHGTSCISIMQAISCIYTLMQNWYILSNVPWRIKSTCSTSSLDCWMIMQCCVVWFQTQAPHWRFDGSVSWLGVHELLLELAAVGSAEYLCLNGCFCEWRTIHSILTIIEVEWYLQTAICKSQVECVFWHPLLHFGVAAKKQEESLLYVWWHVMIEALFQRNKFTENCSTMTHCYSLEWGVAQPNPSFRKTRRDQDCM